jgi:hypothetical protein
MANSILDQSCLEINGQLSTQDQVFELLAKLKALLALGLNSDPKIHTRASLYSYLCVLSDLVEQLETVMA